MTPENSQPTPEWQRFLSADDARLKAEQEEESKLLVSLQAAEKPPAVEEVEQPPVSRHEAMYEDFRMLPESMQEGIIKEITEKRNEGGDPKDLILRAINLTGAYKEFLQPDAGKPKEPGKENWRRELDKILEEMKRIKSQQKKEKPKRPDSRDSGSLNRVN